MPNNDIYLMPLTVSRIARCQGCAYDRGEHCHHPKVAYPARGNFGSISMIVPFTFHVIQCPMDGPEEDNAKGNR